jgi:hypothetical protein
LEVALAAAVPTQLLLMHVVNEIRNSHPEPDQST